ncbi:MAG: NAD-dependent epimerase/dehydratase family protein [Planctomycetota bacterium]
MTTTTTTLITGGAGFIGSHLAAALLADGERVRVLDDFSTGRRENLSPLQRAHGDRLEVIEASILDADAVQRAMQGVRHVSHQAAMISVTDSIARPAPTLRVNVEGTAIVLEAARRAGVEGFVLASSAAVYGDAPGLPKTEQMLPACLSAYAVSKLAGEQMVETYARAHGMHAVALRYFNVYGPRQDPASPYAAAVPLFVSRLRANEAPTIFGDGEQTRDFVFVGDVVRANRLALAARDAGPGPFNVATGRAVTVNALVAQLADLIGARVTPVHADARIGEIRHSLADVTRARNALRFEATMPLADGLRATIA